MVAKRLLASHGPFSSMWIVHQIVSDQRSRGEVALLTWLAVENIESFCRVDAQFAHFAVLRFLHDHLPPSVNSIVTHLKPRYQMTEKFRWLRKSRTYLYVFGKNFSKFHVCVSYLKHGLVLFEELDTLLFGRESQLLLNESNLDKVLVAVQPPPTKIRNFITKIVKRAYLRDTI